jgi:phosphate transport system substrate-binding protein
MSSARWIAPLLAVSLAWPSASARAEKLYGLDEGRAPWVVGASLLNPMTKEVFKRIRARAPLVPEPRIENHTLVQDSNEFCSGIGEDTPDVLAISRRMGMREFSLCVKNGVTDIVEVQVGLEALVFVTRKEDPDIPVTFNTLYRAIAAELPEGDDFLPNSSQTWHDVNSALPKSDIHVIIPSYATVSRQFFDNHFLQGACREIFDYKKIYSAEERVAQCIGLRRDGHVIELGVPYTSKTLVEALEKAPHGTIALLSLRYAMEASDKLKILSLEGVNPNRQTVGSLQYPATRSLYYYVKRAHIKNYDGFGPVQGLREFISEVTRESAIGDTGYLVPLGLVPLSEDAREDARDSALALTRMKR